MLPRPRRARVHALLGVVLALLLLAAPGARAAEYVFGGSAVAGCTLNGAIYSCPALPAMAWNDAMTIAGGYTVNVGSSVNFGFNQTLRMSGTARLAATGNLSVADIARANLQISGGFLTATGTLSVGNQDQTITASLSAGTLNIGSGSDVIINGNLSASGTINIASHAIVNGNITGNTITTGSPVELNGNIVAGTSFTLSSGSTLVGNVTAPVVRILASSVEVTGNINASTSITLESGNRITGNVSTGTLTLNSSNAIVDGNATVDKAVLGWAGRVTRTITCRSGDTAGNCSCVVNNSGWAVDSTYGPHCSPSPTVGPSAAHHFEIWHDGEGLTCAPDSVTVRACANADCTSLHTAGASTTISPVGTSVTIGNMGTASATIARDSAGSVELSAGSGTVCRSPGGMLRNCTFNFADSGFLVDAGASHRAESDQRFLSLTAVRKANHSADCVPAFSGDRSVQFSCQYLNPASGTRPVRLNGIALNAARNAAAACDAGGTAIDVSFNDKGTATLPFRYADVGRVQVTATLASPAMTGADDVTTTPASFVLTHEGPYIAGHTFGVAVEARNTLNVKTPNFGSEAPPAAMNFTPILCEPAGGRAGILGIASAPANPTTAPVWKLRWDDVGLIHLNATLMDGKYLGVSEDASGATGTASNCGGSAGTFVAAALRLTQTPSRGWNYSGQPIPMTVSALSALGNITQNYQGSYASAVTFSALNAAKTVVPAGTGAMTPATAIVPASAFVRGEAAAAPVFAFANARTAPTPITVRASASVTPGGGTTRVIDSSADNPELAREIRSGRLRLFGVFGRAGAALAVPYRAEYWTGGSWLINGLDNEGIAASAVGLSPSPSMQGARVQSVTPMTAGEGRIMLAPPATGIGTVDLALNLGMAGNDTACLAGTRSSTPARMPWLRSSNGNCGPAADPSARATIGVIQPEQRRIIHVREVFR